MLANLSYQRSLPVKRNSNLSDSAAKTRLLVLECSRKQNRQLTNQVLEASDHLCQVAKITRSQIKKLESVGVTTLTQLATEKIDVVQASEPTRAIWTELSLVIAELIRQSEHVAKIPLVRNGCFGRQGKSNLKGCAFVDD